MKQECEIVKDLFPSYIENLVSDETKKYVQNHIAECPNCREILEEIKETNILENEQNEKDEKAQIRIIKKYKRKMKIIKISVVTFIIIVILGISAFISIYMPRYMVIKKSYDRIQEISNMNNYKFTITQINVDYNKQDCSEYIETYYYKDGKFKADYYLDGIRNKSYYGDINSDTILCLFEDTKTKEYQPNINENIFDVFCDIKYNMKNIFSVVGLDFRNDNYNGKDCYVLRFGNGDDTNYREIWIDKDTMLQIREIQIIFNESYFERTFLIEHNIATEQDVTLSNLEEYTPEIEK